MHLHFCVPFAMKQHTTETVIYVISVYRYKKRRKEKEKKRKKKKNAAHSMQIIVSMAFSTSNALNEWLNLLKVVFFRMKLHFKIYVCFYLQDNKKQSLETNTITEINFHCNAFARQTKEKKRAKSSSW